MENQKDKKIKKEILDILKQREICSFGDLVRETEYSYHQILNQVVELKLEGKIHKSKEYHGFFALA